jgi:hypothetical protein
MSQVPETQHINILINFSLLNVIIVPCTFPLQRNGLATLQSSSAKPESMLDSLFFIHSANLASH